MSTLFNRVWQFSVKGVWQTAAEPPLLKMLENWKTVLVVSQLQTPIIKLLKNSYMFYNTSFIKAKQCATSFPTVSLPSEILVMKLLGQLPAPFLLF